MTTIDITDRDVAIAEIRKALKARSGKAWSVTGGRGTAWGWIKIDAPPARQTARYQLKAGAITNNPDDYEEVITNETGGHMTPADRKELGELLDLEAVHYQGISIPAGSDYRKEYVARARGAKPAVIGEPYWD